MTLNTASRPHTSRRLSALRTITLLTMLMLPQRITVTFRLKSLLAQAVRAGITLMRNTQCSAATSQEPRKRPAAQTRCSCSSHPEQRAIRRLPAIIINTPSAIISPQNTGTVFTRTDSTSQFPIPAGARRFGESFTASGCVRARSLPMTLTALTPRKFFRCSKGITSQPSAHRQQCIECSLSRIFPLMTFPQSNMQQRPVRRSTPRCSTASRKQPDSPSWRASARPKQPSPSQIFTEQSPSPAHGQGCSDL